MASHRLDRKKLREQLRYQAKLRVRGNIRDEVYQHRKVVEKLCSSEATKSQIIEETQEKTEETSTAEESNFARALQDYDAKNSGELALRKGDLIVIISKSEDWWEGRLGNEVGVFPSTHVELISEKEVQEFLNKNKQARKGKEELKAEMNDLKSTSSKLDDEIIALKNEIDQLELAKKNLISGYKQRSSEFNCSYYGIDPLEFFYYDLQETILEMEMEFSYNKTLKKYANNLIDKISLFMRELQILADANKNLKTQQKAIEPLIDQVQTFLIDERDREKSTEMVWKDFHRLILRFADQLERILYPDAPWIEKRRKLPRPAKRPSTMVVDATKFKF